MKILSAAALVAALAWSAPPARAQSYDVVDVGLVGLTNSVVSAKAAPGPVLGVNCYNPNAAAVWLQLFDTASSITLGTTPPTLQWQLPPSQSSGWLQVQRSGPAAGGAYYATNSLQVAVTTVAGGSAAPSSSVSCDLLTR